MNIVNKKAGIITGIILVTILFTNIIYAGNSRTNGIYVEKVSVLNGNDIATNGDTVEITVKSEQEIEFIESQIYIGNTIISNLDINCVDNGNGEYKVSYKIPDEIMTEDENEVFEGDNVKLGYSIIVKDADGNETKLESGGDYLITYYRTLKIINFQAEVNGDSKKTFVKDGDVITMSFTLSYPVNDIEGKIKTINNNDIVLTQTKDDPCSYQAEYIVKDESDFDNNMMELILEIQEEGKEKQIITKELFVYYANLINSINYFKSSADYVKDGDKLTITFKTDQQINVEEMTISGYKVNCTSPDNIEWTAELQIDKGMFENDNFNLECSCKITNGEGNEDTFTRNCAVYYAPINVENLNIESDNPQSGFVKNGDKIIITFDTKHPVYTLGSTIKMSEDIELNFNEEIIDGIYKYTSQIEVKNDDNYDDKKIGVNLIVNDTVGNETVTIKEDSDITYYAPIKVENFKIESSNVNKGLVKNGEKICITFETTHPVKATGSTLKMSEDISLEFSRESVDGRYKYTSEFEVENDGEYDNKKIEVNLTVNDDAGNETLEIPKESDITYYAPIEVENFKIESGNENKKYVKNGEKIYITFETTHPVKATGSTLKMSKDINFEFSGKTVDGRYKYTSEFEVENDEEYDNKKIEVNLILNDDAGNETLEIPKESDITYYAPIEVENFKIESGNESKKYVKNGEKIEIVFETTHPVKTTGSALKMSKDINLEFSENLVDGRYKYICEFEMQNDEEYDYKDIRVNLIVSDDAGNDTVEIFKDSDIKYYASINEKNLKIETSNENENYVKDGDKIIITFETTHPIITTGSTLKMSKEKNLEFSAPEKTDDGLYKYTSEFEVENDEEYDNNKIKINLILNDEVGNKPKLIKKDNITYYAPINVKNIKIESSNDNKRFVKNEEKIEITFETTHPIKAKGSNWQVSNKPDFEFSPLDQTDNGVYKYTSEFVVGKNKKYDNKKIVVNLIVNDDAGNAPVDKLQESDITYYAPIEVENLKIESSNENKKYVKSGEKIEITFETTHPVIVTGSTLKMSKSEKIKFSKKTNKNRYKYSSEFKVKNIEKNDNKKINVTFTLNDAAGNKPEEKKEDTNITYYAPIKIKNFKIKSNNVNKRYVKNGENVEITFETTHPVKITGSTLKMLKSENIKFSKVTNDENETNDNVYKYKSLFKVKNNEKNDNKNVSVKFTLNDAAGNNPKEITKDTKIKYYAPIKIKNFKIKSNNVNKRYVKNGEIVEITFETTHPVKITESTLTMSESVDIKFSEIRNNKVYKYTSKFKVENNKENDNKKVCVKLTVIDNAGNLPKDRSKESAITYYAPLEIEEDESYMKSNNQGGDVSIARNNDNVEVCFATTHPVNITDATIAGQKAYFEKINSKDDGKIYWISRYEVHEGDTANMNVIDASFTLTDNAGNKQKTITNKDLGSVTYYAPIQVNNLKVSTDNTKDENLYAKDGNTVAVEFFTNHIVNLKHGIIAGNIANVSYVKVSDTEYRWRIDYTIKNGDISDLSNVGFDILLEDDAHNESVNINQYNGMIQNIITYYAPITAVTDYASDYKDGTYVKNGDTITVNCRTSHPVKTTSASIAGRQATVRGNDTNALSMIYTIPENEGAIPEDGIKFEYTIEDIAGNELKVNQVSDTSAVKNIIYDRTLPVVNVSNDNTGGVSFYSDTAKYSLEYTGTNIFVDGMSCMINGVERIGDLEKHPIDDGYRIDIELDAEENYLIKASCIDLAGNKDLSDTSISVTVDKTNPSLKIVNINTGHIFNSEFTLADYLNIEEKNLKDIDCILTDNEGTHDWDINNIVKGDGKKTVTLKMTDMAGNTSDTYVYEFYVDVTAPSPVIIDKESGYMFKQGKNTKKFSKNLNLNIFLDDINVSKEPDKFTSIKLLDEDENEYMDVLKSGKTEEDGSYTIGIDKDGEYTLNVQAVDSVGNDTGLCKYSFMVGEKPWYIRLYENTPVFVTVVVCMSLLTVMGGAGFVIKKKGK